MATMSSGSAAAGKISASSKPSPPPCLPQLRLIRNSWALFCNPSIRLSCRIPCSASWRHKKGSLSFVWVGGYRYRLEGVNQKLLLLLLFVHAFLGGLPKQILLSTSSIWGFSCSIGGYLLLSLKKEVRDVVGFLPFFCHKRMYYMGPSCTYRQKRTPELLPLPLLSPFSRMEKVLGFLLAHQIRHLQFRW